MMRVVGAYIWSVCAAGWAVIGFALDHWPAIGVAFACLIVGVLWSECLPED